MLEHIYTTTGQYAMLFTLLKTRTFIRPSHFLLISCLIGMPAGQASKNLHRQRRYG